LLYNYALEYTIRKLYANQNGMVLKCTHQLLILADDVENNGCRHTQYKEKYRSFCNS